MSKLAWLAVLTMNSVVPAMAETVAIVNARILTMGPQGDIASGSVMVRDGKIVAVGPSLRIPPGTRVVDGTGKVLTPGLVEAVTPLGLNVIAGPGIPGIASSAPRLSAAFEIAPDINPFNPQIAEARVEGVTRAVVTPNSAADKPFGGQGVVIRLSTGLRLVANPHAAIVTNAGEAGAQAAGGSRGAWRTRMKESLDAARTFARTGRIGPDVLDQLSLSVADLRALSAVIAGDEPLLVEVDRASDILNVLDMAKENKVKVVLSGAAEAWLVAEEIAASDVPVILDADENQAFSFDALNASNENASRVQEAGVLIAFKPGPARILFPIRTPRFGAGRAARFGLSPDEALAAITINPARIFGFSNVVGSIEVGKDADLVMWSGDPLETSTVARMVMLQGVEIPLIARSRELRDRYIGTVLGADAPQR
jgi:imidazolonepropionase-like amidohydrolase